MFQGKSGTTEAKKGAPAPKKIGKLNFGAKKEPAKEPEPPKKKIGKVNVGTKKEPEKKPEPPKKVSFNKGGAKKEEPPKKQPEAKKEEPPKKEPEAKKEEPPKKEPEAKKEEAPKPEPAAKKEEPPKPEPVAMKEEAPKPEPVAKKEEPPKPEPAKKEPVVKTEEVEKVPEKKMEKPEAAEKKPAPKAEEQKGKISVSAPAETETKLSVHVDTDLDLDSELEANITDSEGSKEKVVKKEEKKDEKPKEAAKPPAPKQDAAKKPEQPAKPAEAPKKDVPAGKAAAPAAKPAEKKDAPKQDAKAKPGTPTPVQEGKIEAVPSGKKAAPPQPKAGVKTQAKPVPVTKKEPPKAAGKKPEPEMPKPVTEEVISAVPAEKSEQAPKSEAQKAPAAKPKPEMTTIKPMQIFRPSGEDFYNTIFYFSGMGAVVGSSLSKGIFVPDRLTRTSLDLDVVEQLENYKPVEQKRRETVVESARNQAVDLSEELRKLRALLFGLPSWGDSSNLVDQGQIGGPIPPLGQPPKQAPWKNPAVDLISQANAVMVQALPKQPPMPQQPPPQQPPQQRREPKRPSAPPGGVSMYGVFSGEVDGKLQASWQDKYGARDISAPPPQPSYDPGVEVDPKGLKSWQASRLRGQEARGYEFKRPAPQTGADYGGDVFSGTGGRKQDLQPDEDILSYAPFLVSNKTKSVDRKQLFTNQSPTPAQYTPTQYFKPIPPTTSFPPLASPQQLPYSPQQLPYCDL